MVYPDLSGIENLFFAARLYAISSPDQRVRSLCERYALDPFIERPTRTYSRGQLQRLALARAVVHEPRLLLLDEPSTGLDNASVERLVFALDQERKRGTISVLVTHDSVFADRVADRYYQLRRGVITGCS
jgi:heme exporter protein A